MIVRDIIPALEQRLTAPNPLIQVVLGPRQVGKTTAVEQLLGRLPTTTPRHYASADAVFRSDWSWLERQWQEANAKGSDTVLVLDEIQKVENWSEIIKKCWDEQRRAAHRIKVVLLGSSSLLLQSGLSESLAGRFELLRAYHWNYRECVEGFGLTLDQYLIYGGYPGALAFRDDPDRWLSYMKSSIIETVLDKDISQIRRVTRPALFRQVFELLCSYPAAEISLRKLVGQLQDPGTIDTIKHYIELLEGAFLLKTLRKFTTNPIQKRSSSPKILPLAPALCTFARADITLTDSLRGRLFELAVGLDLARLPGELSYWRVDNDEVDYVYRHGSKIIAIEVKSGRRRSPHGLIAFKRAFPSAQTVTISPDQYDSFCSDVRAFISAVL